MAHNRDYFEANVDMAVELEEEEYGRFWYAMKGNEVDYFCNCYKGLISDVDYSCKQSDDWCRKVLNAADINWTKNREWVKKHNLKSFSALVDYIIDNQLVA